MRLPSAIGAGSIAIALFAGGFAIGHGVSEDNTKSSGKPSVLGQVFARTPESTSTTSAPQAPPTSQAPSTGTVGAPPPAQATLQAAPATTSPPVTTTRTIIVSSGEECGTGTASVSVSQTTFPRQATANTTYQSNVRVDVNNGINKPIQLDSLAARLTLDDGSQRDIVFDGAVGTVIQPGSTGTFTAAVDTGKTPGRSVGVSSFAFHTAGQPQCAGRPA